ncbi:MAG: hypothetical protein NTU73_14435 [Ignavibacteriae bacterium]|nr:hypothetical protein [Ignavibacteriota bacterium]
MKKTFSIILFALFCFGNVGFSFNSHIPQNNSGDSTYVNISAHSKFRYFWKDFSRAVKVGDINNVIKMTNFPFVDYYNKAYNRVTLTANDESEFRELYSQIFKGSVVEVCTYDYPITCDDIQSSDHLPKGCFTTEEKMFNPEYFFIITKDADRNLLFGKVGGVYKLIGIKFL